ncbi:MAG TPA: hypothetical protein VM489_12095 [Burkholderiales bacterium]|nr:hypothetical protein [Burkholderiales bacterium]
MRKCEVCGQETAVGLAVLAGEDGPRTFDTFECAIVALAPRCAHCGCRYIRHPVRAAGAAFCSKACAQYAGVRRLPARA